MIQSNLRGSRWISLLLWSVHVFLATDYFHFMTQQYVITHVTTLSNCHRFGSLSTIAWLSSTVYTPTTFHGAAIDLARWVYRIAWLSSIVYTPTTFHGAASGVDHLYRVYLDDVTQNKNKLVSPIKCHLTKQNQCIFRPINYCPQYIFYE